MVLVDGEPHFSRRCEERWQADYVAKKLGRDQKTFGGYTEVDETYECSDLRSQEH